MSAELNGERPVCPRFPVPGFPVSTAPGFPGVIKGEIPEKRGVFPQIPFGIFACFSPLIWPMIAQSM